MGSERPHTASLAEVLDRILDTGVVIDIWLRVSLVGIELVTIEARVVIAAVDTFLYYETEISIVEAAEVGSPLDDADEIESASRREQP